MLGTVELLKLVKEQKLVENLCQRELENPEGTGFDLRVGEVYKLKDGDAFLGQEERHTPDIDLVAKFGTEKEYTLLPGEFVLVKTLEKVNMPSDIASAITPRSTLQRSGVLFLSAACPPGYSGELTFGLHNAGKNLFRFELGARFAHARFFRTGTNISDYRGQWQGGRVSTQGKKETQV